MFTPTVNYEDVFSVVNSVSFIFVTLSFFGLWYVLTRVPESGYSIWSRCIHKLAFNTLIVQYWLVKIENLFVPRQAPEKPVFITALPRAGTTILLDILYETGRFVSQQYSDMPFVLLPRLSRWIGNKNKVLTEPKERWHRDGIYITQNSPEALDEVIFKLFYYKNALPYQKLHLFTGFPNNNLFKKFYTAHINKLMALKTTSDDTVRYLSKNNSNILRTAFLEKLFPESCIIIMFREPLQHALSLQKQHKRFMQLQQKNPFTLSYMNGIGQDFFGKGLQKPPFFKGDNLLQAAETIEFWLELWIDVYNKVLKQKKESATFIAFEKLCNQPQRVLALLAAQLQIPSDKLVLASATLRVPEKQNVVLSNKGKELHTQATLIYEKLLNRSL
ncbi:hypothetical protein GC194_05415 [bacterium]|nr:hypothetical protein [bacterium]